MFSEFKAFIARGNVIDLAVAVMIGAAFGKIVSSFTDDILMPIIAAVAGKVDFSSQFILLGPVPANYHGAPGDYVALKAAGVPMLGIGQFATVVIDFLIVAFALFLVVREANRFQRKKDAAPPAPAPEPADVALLREIRDELRRK